MNHHFSLSFLLLLSSAALNGASMSITSSDIFEIASGGDHIRLKELITEANREARDKDGRTPLHLAARFGHTHCIEALSERRADIEAQDNDGRTPLHLAARNGKTQSVRKLLDMKANIEAEDSLGNFTSLHLAAHENHTESVKVLIEERANKEAPNIDGRTPLHLAARNGHTQSLTVLLEKKANIEAQDKDGNTPLHLTVRNDHITCLSALMDNSANLDAQDKDGNTPLHLAAFLNKTNCLKALAAKANINAINSHRATPLHQTVRSSHIDGLKALLDSKANLEVQDNDGNTPLHLAAILGKIDCLKALIGANANINATNHNGLTPLHLTVRNGRVECLKSLIDKGANINARDKDGNTALYNAINIPIPSNDIVALLLENGAHSAQNILEISIKLGKTSVIPALIKYSYLLFCPEKSIIDSAQARLVSVAPLLFNSGESSKLATLLADQEHKTNIIHLFLGYLNEGDNPSTSPLFIPQVQNSVGQFLSNKLIAEWKRIVSTQESLSACTAEQLSQLKSLFDQTRLHTLLQEGINNRIARLKKDHLALREAVTTRTSLLLNDLNKRKGLELTNEQSRLLASFIVREGMPIPVELAQCISPEHHKKIEALRALLKSTKLKMNAETLIFACIAQRIGSSGSSNRAQTKS